VGHTDSITDSITDLAMSPDGCRAVSSSFDRSLKVWDVETAAIVATLTGDAAPIWCAFVTDSTIIAGDEAGRVHLLALERPRRR
jgi:WD40 repeat protein